MNKKFAIVIPVYKDNPSEEEKISLYRIQQIMGNYSIYYVVPQKIKETVYLDAIPNAEIVYMDNCFFDGFDGYNLLMTSKEFYANFLQFDKILICQADVFILSNQLEAFVSLDYDYIGAPCAKHKPWEERIYVGNGGLSLRDVRATIQAIDEGEKKGLISGKNEDTFFSDFGEKYSDKYKVAPVEIALRFAFDQPLAELCYEIMGGKLPMGIHGWFNYDVSFSKKILSRYIPNTYLWGENITYSDYIIGIEAFLISSENVYFYGAGDIGRVFFDFCKIRNIKFNGYIVSDNQRIEENDYKGKKIQHLSECDNLDHAAVVVTILQRYRAREPYKDRLKMAGVEKIMEVSASMVFAVEDFVLRSKGIKHLVGELKNRKCF